MQIIQSISIKNFRSIKSIENLKLSDLNIFTGENDHGKSNILRALNLFFNDETDLNQPFNFEDDYCQKAAKGKGQQRQIKIEIIIQPPKERFKNSNKIKWTKTWTADGPRKNEKKELNSELVLKKTVKATLYYG